MKTFFKLISVSAVMLGLLISCDKNRGYDRSMYYPNVLVTVKPVSDGSCFLQLDDKTTLKPVNLSKSPFGKKEVRALANVSKVKESAAPYNQAVKVNWIDSIRTKALVPTAGADNDKVFGTAPIEIVNNWITIVEDGYITICFYGIWGDSGKVHYVNMLTGTNPKDPYELELRHDSNGDVAGYRREATGIIAFNIRSLPDTKGKTVKLKIKYRSFRGDKVVTFDYVTGQTKIVTSLPERVLESRAAVM